MDTTVASTKERRIFGFSPNVFWLGVTSFLTDISSEMIITILPLFLANVLKVSLPIIGLIEGIAESTATLLKVVSGWLSDKVGHRKNLALLGYSLSNLTKPLLYFANTWGLVLGVRFTDRVGKGIRTSPRDALLADSAPKEELGRSFGLHRAMDTGGAVLGLAVAAAIVYMLQQGALDLTRDAYQTIVLVGMIPGILSVPVVYFFIQEVRADRGAKAAVAPAQAAANPAAPAPAAAAPGLSRQFKWYLFIIILFTLGNSSDAFLILRAQSLGLGVFQILLLLVGFNLLYTIVALPAGVLSDRLGRRGLILAGWSVYALVYLGFGMAQEAWQLVVVFVLYGLYYGAAEGVGRAYVADLVPSERRGIAYGLYHGAVGVTALPASLAAGILWQLYGPPAAFFFGAALAGVAAFLLWTTMRG